MQLVELMKSDILGWTCKRGPDKSKNTFWITKKNLTTGCLLETVKDYLLIAQARKQTVSWDMCPFVHSICTSWYLVSKKVHNFSAIIHLWRLQKCIIEEIWKIYWKSTIKKHQYCFANISAKKTRIVMKFYMVVNYNLVSISLKFHDDPCAYMRALES